MRLVLVVLLALSLQANSQITKDSLIKKMVKECCLEIKKKDFSKLDKSNYEMELGMLMVPVFVKNADDIQTVYGAKFTDKVAMRKMGEDIGMKLIIDCPEFMSKMMNMADGDADEEKPKAGEKVTYEPPKFSTEKTEYALPPLPSEAKALAIEKATLVSVNTGDVTTITIKTADGKTEKLYWMEYFENADYFQNNQSKFIGKKIEYSVEEKEIYNASKKSYKTIKVITMLDLQ